MKKIVLQATKGAPEFYSQGNIGAEQKNGYFETEDRGLADAIISAGFGKEIEEKQVASKSSTKAPKAKKEKPTVNSTATQTSAEADAEKAEANSDEGEKQ